MTGSTRLSAVQVRAISLGEVRSIVAEQQDHAYAVLDACNQPLVIDKSEELGDIASVCLYGGKAREQFRLIAPYLFRLDQELLQWILDGIAMQPWWGILLLGPPALSEVRQQLLRYLKVQDYNRQSLYFRFYDPRILPPFLQACSSTEICDFFGPIQSFIVQVDSEQFVQIDRA